MQDAAPVVAPHRKCAGQGRNTRRLAHGSSRGPAVSQPTSGRGGALPAHVACASMQGADQKQASREQWPSAAPHLPGGRAVADAVQRVDEHAGGHAGRVGQRVVHDKALAQAQQHEDADEGDEQQVGYGARQLRVIHILRAHATRGVGCSSVPVSAQRPCMYPYCQRLR